ncbi:hypothetical protein glysoja_010012 [Glycine soja]|nr:hypothetical protein glysoja_010012 [Glycine soja]
MHDARPVNTPLLTTCNLASGDVPSCDGIVYCQLVDSLQYLSLTCPDIAFPINKLLDHEGPY